MVHLLHRLYGVDAPGRWPLWTLAVTLLAIPVATHHNQFFSESPMTTTTGCLQSLQRLKERNKPSVRWKSFAVYKLVWWHFQVGWACGLQFVFLWDNVNNQKYVWIILLKMTLFGFPKVKWLPLTGEVDKSVGFSCRIFSGFNVPRIIKIG